MGEKTFCFSVDVDWVRGSEVALPALYDLCDELGIRGTFFSVGGFASEYGELLAEGLHRGHEVGSHGWEHGLRNYENYGSSPYDDQLRWLELTTGAVEKATGVRPHSFRAPNLWVGETTLRVLETLGYTHDSSVPARRYDAGMGQLGHQTRYFRAPRDPYHPSREHLAVPGDSPVVEVPPSAFFVPMNMSGLRAFGVRALRWANRRIRARADTLVFYVHPAEFVSPDAQALKADIPRRHRRGIGPQNVELLRRYLSDVLELGYTPVRVDQTAPGGRISAAPAAASPRGARGRAG
jgi:peptidoglycan/xylan/chitin deacetylase (PgdA/CDA1 family)